MNKWQIICPLSSIAIVAVVFMMISGRGHRRHWVCGHSGMIGKDLVSTTNSAHLVDVQASLRERLSGFLAFPADVAQVEMGDEPTPIGDGTATSRVVLSNTAGEYLGIRLMQDSKTDRFHVLSYWTITEPRAAPKGGPAAPGANTEVTDEPPR